MYEKLAAKERKTNNPKDELKLAKESEEYYKRLIPRPTDFILDYAHTEKGLYVIKRLAGIQKAFIKNNSNRSPISK